MLHLDEVQAIVADIKYRDWTFHTGTDPAWFLQVRFRAEDSSNPYPSINPQGLRIPKGQPEYEAQVHHGRKWLLSPHMTRSEIVQTALMAILAAVEHEAREEFQYKGQAIFGPHMDVTLLARRLADHAAELLEVRAHE